MNIVGPEESQIYGDLGTPDKSAPHDWIIHDFKSY